MGWGRGNPGSEEAKERIGKKEGVGVCECLDFSSRSYHMGMFVPPSPNVHRCLSPQLLWASGWVQTFKRAVGVWMHSMTQRGNSDLLVLFQGEDFLSLGEHCMGGGVAPTLRQGKLFPALLGLLTSTHHSLPSAASGP